MALEYVGWKAICDTCGKVEWISAGTETRPGLLVEGACGAIDHGWGYQFLTDIPLVTDGYARWLCPSCYKKENLFGRFEVEKDE